MGTPSVLVALAFAALGLRGGKPRRRRPPAPRSREAESMPARKRSARRRQAENRAGAAVAERRRETERGKPVARHRRRPSSLTICPVTPRFRGRDRRRRSVRSRSPQPNCAAIQEAFWKYAVLIFPGQDLTAEQHLAFARELRPGRDRHARWTRRRRRARFGRRVRRHVQPRRGRQDLGRGQPPAHVQDGQPALAHGQLVQALPGLVLAAVCPHDRAHRRPHGIRRPARRLRRAAGRD